MTPSEWETTNAIRQAVQAEADAAPPADDVWARMRRRLRRRRAARMAVGALVVALGGLAGLVGWQTLGPADSEVVLGEPTVPAGWRDVAVGGAVVSVPPGWDVVDARDHDGGGRPCPSGSGPSLWVRDEVSLWLPDDCAPGPATTAVQVGALSAEAPALVDSRQLAGADGATGQLGAIAAWHATARPPDEGFADALGPPGEVAAWLAPAVELGVAVPDGVAADPVLATIRPRGQPDPDAVVAFRHQRGLSGGPIDYLAITAHGRRHVWFTREPDPHDEPFPIYTLWQWPGLAADRFAAAEVDDRAGITVMAGRPDGGHLAWHQPAAARDLTRGSFPQAAWSPDGTAIAWYAPRPEPVMGLAQWADVDALADGQPPTHQQSVAVADGPVQADPPVMRWTADANNDEWTITLRRGQPPPWNPDRDAGDRVSPRWQLPLAPDSDGTITLADPVTFNRLEAP